MLYHSEHPFLLSYSLSLLFSLLMARCLCCSLHYLPTGSILLKVFARKYLAVCKTDLR